MPISSYIAALVSLALIPWVIYKPRLAVLGLLASLVIGQLIRIPAPGQGGGLLVSDLAAVLVLAAALWQLVTARQKLSFMTHRSLLLFTPFLAWSIAGLIVNMPALGVAASAVALAYWLRLSATLLLVPALFILSQDERNNLFLRRGLLTVIAVLCLIGFGQLVFYPDLQILAGSGWDPHQGRLVATWLDPNFFGAFLAVTLPWIVARGLRAGRYWLWLLAATQCIALFFTQSRSSLLALVAAVFIASPLALLWLLRRPRAVRFFSLLSCAGILAVIFSGLWLGLGQRAVTVWRDDPTAALRIEGLKAAWPLAEKNMWLGVGYNAYQFAAADAGILNNFTIHSRAGADNSLLTIWITTGTIGLILFLLSWSVALITLIQKAIQDQSAPAAAVATGLLIIFIHSQFVNSLLYSHLVITIIILAVLELSDQHPKTV